MITIYKHKERENYFVYDEETHQLMQCGSICNFYSLDEIVMLPEYEIFFFGTTQPMELMNQYQEIIKLENIGEFATIKNQYPELFI